MREYDLATDTEHREDLENGVRREQQRETVYQSANMAAVNIVLGLICMFVLIISEAMNFVIPLMWFSIFVILGIMQVRTYLTKRWQPLPDKVSGKFLRKAEIMVAMISFWWSIPLIFSYMSGASNTTLILMTCFQLGTSAGVSALLTSLPRITLIYNLIAFVPVVVVNLLIGGVVHTSLLCMYVVLVFAMTLGTFNVHYRLRLAVRARLDAEINHANLHDAVESLHDAFCLVDANGAIQASNQKYRNLFEDVDIEMERVKSMDSAKQLMLPNGRWALRTVQKTKRGGYVRIDTDITGLKRREKELEDANREASQARALNENFLSQIGSDLQVPVDVLSHFSALLGSRSNIALNDKEVSDIADKIEKNARHVNRLVADLVEVSRIGATNKGTQLQSIKLVDVINESCDLSLSQNDIISNDNLFDISISSRVSEIFGDYVALQRILFNLLSERVMLSDPKHKIVVRAVLDVEGHPKITIKSRTELGGIDGNKTLLDVTKNSQSIVNELARIQDINIDVQETVRTHVVTLKLPKNARRRYVHDVKNAG